MKKTIFSLILLILLSFSSQLISKEILCKVHIKEVYWKNYNFEILFSIPHKDFLFNIVYKKNIADEWFIKDIQETFIFKNKILDQTNVENEHIDTIKNSQYSTTKPEIKIDLKDIAEITNIKIKKFKFNEQKIYGKTYDSFNKMFESFSTYKQLKYFEEYRYSFDSKIFYPLRQEIYSMNESNEYIYFDNYKKNYNSFSLTKEIDGSLFNDYNDKLLKIESSFRNTFQKNSIDIVFVDGSLNLEGNCINYTTKTKDDKNTETKLIELKSLFEKELITKKEYDTKRNQILNDM